MFSSARGDWSTPQEFFDDLDAEFHFTLDVCATEATAKCPLFLHENALEADWHGPAYMNPPYGRAIGAWLAKAYSESLRGVTVVCLIPSRTDTRWWHSYVMKAGEIRFIKGRLHFDGHKNAAPFPSAIAIFRPASLSQ